MNDFEREIFRSLKLYFPFYGRTESLSSRYKRSEKLFPDFWAWNGHFIFLEAKSCKEKKFYPRGRVKKHQLTDLVKNEELGGVSFVLVNFRARKPRTLVVPTKYLRDTRITIKSRRYPELRRWKKDRKFYWDLSKLNDIIKQKGNGKN